MTDIVIAAYRRSPFTQANKGALIKVRPDDLAADVVRALVDGIDTSAIEDVIVGCAFPEGEQGLNVARLVGFIAGLPRTVAGTTVNRFCGSSMQAVHQAAGAIKMGAGEAFVCAGVESMTRVPTGGFNPMPNPALSKAYPQAYISMGETAENVAQRYQVSRAEQEAFAARSQHKAAAARAEGRFADEIVPISPHPNPLPRAGEGAVSSGEGQAGTASPSPRLRGEGRGEGGQAGAASPSPRLRGEGRGEGGQAGTASPSPRLRGEGRGEGGPRITEDGCIRPDTTPETLATLKPAFRVDGTVTAGTSSPLTDGAAAVLVCTAEYARANGLTPLARVKSVAVSGCAPEVMGMGPVEATRKVLARAGLDLRDIDVIELNEAFASQSIACIHELGMDEARVNLDGGAIALGHPMGATGARIVGKAASLLHRTGGRYALATQCIGGGQGIATVLEAIA